MMDRETVESVEHPKVSKRWIIPTTILVTVILILSTILWLKVNEERLPTYQEIIDTGSDPLGWDMPSDYPQFEPGDVIYIKDQIIDIYYLGGIYGQPPSSATVTFPYRDGVWLLFNNISKAFALVYDDIGPYAPGDWIELVGIVEGNTHQDIYYEIILWKVKGGPGQIIPPIVTLSNSSKPLFSHVVEIAYTNVTHSIIHYKARLYKEDVAFVDMDLSDGLIGRYLRFEDREKIGYLGVGDKILMAGLEPGNYTLAVKYAEIEISRISFFIEP